jgi:hypothetical protein
MGTIMIMIMMMIVTFGEEWGTSLLRVPRKGSLTLCLRIITTNCLFISKVELKRKKGFESRPIQCG